MGTLNFNFYQEINLLNSSTVTYLDPASEIQN